MVDTTNSRLRVCVRLRPTIYEDFVNSKRERSGLCTPERCVFISSNGQTIEICRNECHKVKFTVDHAFVPHHSQQDVYKMSIKDMVRSSLYDGFHCAFLAYGQTGSGKSFTMFGNSSSPSLEDRDGMVSLALTDVFARVDQLRKTDRHAAVILNFMQLYNEKIYDLLGNGEEESSRASQSQPLFCRGHRKNRTSKSLMIRETKDQQIYVENLSDHVCSSLDDALGLLREGLQRRATKRTFQNFHSSRSHAIIKITLEFEDHDHQDVETDGKEEGSEEGSTGSALSLADLFSADSEDKDVINPQAISSQRTTPGTTVHRIVPIASTTINTTAATVHTEELEALSQNDQVLKPHSFSHGPSKTIPVHTFDFFPEPPPEVPTTREAVVRRRTMIFVDLAGSERLKKSPHSGKRLKETMMINKSISTLGNCIHALAAQAQLKQKGSNLHVPYRDSKLTRILAGVMGNHSKTCILANIGPCAYNHDETYSTLQFAARAMVVRKEVKAAPTSALILNLAPIIASPTAKSLSSPGTVSDDVLVNDSETNDGKRSRLTLSERLAFPLTIEMPKTSTPDSSTASSPINIASQATIISPKTSIDAGASASPSNSMPIAVTTTKELLASLLATTSLDDGFEEKRKVYHVDHPDVWIANEFESLDYLAGKTTRSPTKSIAEIVAGDTYRSVFAASDVFNAPQPAVVVHRYLISLKDLLQPPVVLGPLSSASSSSSLLVHSPSQSPPLPSPSSSSSQGSPQSPSNLSPTLMFSDSLTSDEQLHSSGGFRSHRQSVEPAPVMHIADYFSPAILRPAKSSAGNGKPDNQITDDRSGGVSPSLTFAPPAVDYLGNSIRSFPPVNNELSSFNSPAAVRNDRAASSYPGSQQSPSKSPGYLSSSVIRTPTIKIDEIMKAYYKGLEDYF